MLALGAAGLFLQFNGLALASVIGFRRAGLRFTLIGIDSRIRRGVREIEKELGKQQHKKRKA